MNDHQSRSLPDPEFAIIVLRWIAVAFAVVQTATYYQPFPDGIESLAWAVNGLFAAAAVVLTAWWLLLRRRGFDRATSYALGVASLAVDAAFCAAVTWVYAFDPETAVFAITYVVPIEAAYRFGMRGAMFTMVALAVSYAARDAWAASRWDIELLPASISFRMGIGFLIAAIAGAMSMHLRREHLRLADALLAEQDAAAALRSLDELRSTFLSAVSHELRTPLTSILGFAMTIERRDDELTTDSRMMLDQIIEQSRRLELLLEDLLEIERMDRSSVALLRQQVDVAALARRRASALAAESGRQLLVDADPAVGVIDSAKVERMVDNLLGNALKYTPESTSVEVHVERAGEGILLSVDDHGLGVPEALRSTIFAPFERGALTSVHMPGTGIGLSLVDRFARLHGGRAWVEERPDHTQGASFRVWLPDGPEGEQVVTIAREWSADAPGD